MAWLREVISGKPLKVSGPPPCLIAQRLRSGNWVGSSEVTLALVLFLEYGLGYSDFGLDTDILLDYVLGKLENPHLCMMIQGHLAECESCQSLGSELRALLNLRPQFQFLNLLN